MRRMMVFLAVLFVVFGLTDTPVTHAQSNSCNTSNIATLACFELWRREFRGEISSHSADFNADGKISLADFEYWRRLMQESAASSPTPPLLTPSPGLEHQGTVFIGVDQTTNTALSSEISRFLQDLESEGYTVALMTYTDQTPEIIRSEIQQIYETASLEGVIFIGDIPYKQVTQSPTGNYPSDAFYRDFYSRCTYDQNGNMISDSLWNRCFFGKPLNLHDYWIGRIKPPVQGIEGITLLKRYFDRNHAYRTGNTTYSDDMLAYLEILADPHTQGTNISEDFLSSVDSGHLFTRNQVTLLAPLQNQGYSDCSMDSTYINELKNKKYKYVFLNAHGAPQYHLCNVTGATLQTNPSNALFYEFRSCSVGDYSKENYMAGWYVFSGEGLVADAAQSIIFSASVADSIFNNFLARGLSFGEGKRLSGSGLFSLIGDPTLKLSRTVDSQAQIRVSSPRIDFGNVPVCIDYANAYNCQKKNAYFDVENTGTEDLIIPPLQSTALFRYSELLPANPDIGYFGNVLIGTSNYREIILHPGEKIQASAWFFPPKNGDFSGSYFLLSNSRLNPVLEIPFTAKGV